MIRKLAGSLFALSLLVGGYALWPMVSAYQIKQAVKDGDVATLERKVHWAPVRASLKASLAVLARDDDAARVSYGQPTPSLWGRIKAMAAPMVIEKMVDSYVTPEGVTKLRYASASVRSLLGMTPAGGGTALSETAGDQAAAALDASAESGAVARFLSFYNRIVRARFHSLSAVEFEIADRHTPERRYISQFELSGFEWKLASVRIIGAGF